MRLLNAIYRFRYPRLTLFSVAVLLSIFLFRDPVVNQWVTHLGSFGYLGALIAGMLFSSGFTSPFAVGFFITLNPPSNLLLFGFIGGLGALISDLFLLHSIRRSFSEEFTRASNSKRIKSFEKNVEKYLGSRIKTYLLYTIVGTIIASPLPDEVGITLLAGAHKIDLRILAAISFFFNTLGIIVLLII